MDVRYGDGFMKHINGYTTQSKWSRVAAATHWQEDHILTTLEEAVSNEGFSQAQPSNYTLDIEGDDLVIGVLHAMLSKTPASKTTRLLG